MAKTANAGIDAGDEEFSGDERPALSEALHRKLTAHRTVQRVLAHLRVQLVDLALGLVGRASRASASF